MKIGRLRRLSQIIALIIHNIGWTIYLKTGIITPCLYCYACPLAAFGCPLGTLQHFIAFHEIPYYWIGTIGLYSTLGGRVYCGWLCPFGAFQDLVRSIGRRIGVRRLKLRYFIIPSLILFFSVVALAYVYEDTLFCRICPSGTLFGLFPYYLLNPEEPLGFYAYIHILVLAVVVLLTLFIDRVWCRYLCPIGIVYGLANKFSFLTIEFDENKCTNCGACANVCPMGLKLPIEAGKSPGCILCGKCVEICPNGTIRYRLRK